MSDIKSYRLYAMKLSNTSIERAMGERFSRVTPEYVLVYTDSEKPENAIQLEESEASLMTQADAQWLLDCNVALIAEEAARQKPEILRQLSDKVDELEEALKAEKRKLTEKGEDSNA